MQPQFFWLSVALVYGGLFLLGLDFYFEPDFSRRFKWVGEILLLSAIAFFSLKFVFVSAPINVLYVFSDQEYVIGATINGIAWRPTFSELDVIVNNPTDDNYDDINILVRPDYPVATIRQLSNLGDVSFEDYFGVTNTLMIQEIGKPAVPMVFLATNAGYKVHCGRIPPKSSLRLVMALVNFKPAVIKNTFPVMNEIETSDFVLEQTITEKGSNAKFSYFFGNIENNSYAPRPKSTHFSVSGSYVGTNRRRFVNKDITAK